MTDMQSHAPIEDSRLGSIAGRAMWLDLKPDPVYAVLHTPADIGQGSVAVLMLPTFGWDNDWSYRPGRAWATALAERGAAVLRIDLPGTEDSVGSALAPNRVESWIEVASAAAAWLREHSGCDRLIAVGIGLGGMLAYEAVADGAAIDDLVLWGVRESGRAYTRELRTLAAVGEAPADAARDQGRADGVIGIRGHRISTGTMDALAAIRLSDHQLPDAHLRRVLLVGRDAHGVDGRLQEHLEQSRAQLTVRQADDYKLLVARGELQLLPTETISASIEWMLDHVAELEPLPHAPHATTPQAVDTVTFDHNGVSIRESLTEVVTAAGRVLGIISEPAAPGRAAPYCLLLTNAGTLRRTGPGRMSTEIARNAAAGGTPAARFDLPGLGDSDGTVTRTFERNSDDDRAALTVISEIYDHLEQLGVAARFVPAGLCLAGYFALMMVPEDSRSMGAIGLNAPTLRWSDVQSRAVLRTVTAEMGPLAAMVPPQGAKLPLALRSRWYRLQQQFRAAEQWGRVRLTSVHPLWRTTHRQESASAAQAIDKLGRAGVPVFFELSHREPLVNVFAQAKLKRRLGRFPSIRIEQLDTEDHDLRPLWAQDAVFERISRMLGVLSAYADAHGAAGDLSTTESGIPPFRESRPAADR